MNDDPKIIIEDGNYSSRSELKKQLISEKLISDRNERSKRPRTLSNHVISRFYRPPEIILMEKNYDACVDIWSVGCVFAELLNCL